jgi:hypothetical protein
VKRCELYAVPVDLADIEILPDLGNFGGGDVVGSAPYAFGRLVLAGISIRLRCRGASLGRSVEALTWSDSVSQCARSMSVATRPGASGVPL